MDNFSLACFMHQMAWGLKKLPFLPWSCMILQTTARIITRCYTNITHNSNNKLTSGLVDKLRIIYGYPKFKVVVYVFLAPVPVSIKGWATNRNIHMIPGLCTVSMITPATEEANLTVHKSRRSLPWAGWV